MPIETRHLHTGADGEQWLLARDAAAGRVFVLHEPTPTSGGEVTEIDIAEFLIRGVYGPEHLELLRLIGTLVKVG